MRPYLLAVHAALFFALIIILVLGAAFLLFIHVAGHELVEELGRLRGYQGDAMIQTLEAGIDSGEFAAGHLADDSSAVALVQAAAKANGLGIRLTDDIQPTRNSRGRSGETGIDVDVEGRVCTVFGPPTFETWVPVLADGQPVGHLIIHGPLHSRGIHMAFHRGLLRIGLIALLFAAVLAVYVTAPLRRMSRSMDRVAAGDLEHRVAVRGRDEVAAMGRSFNTMTDRIRGMVVGQKELMAGISHELRSPLARMKMTLELMRGEDGNGKRISALELEVDAVDALVEELLLASRFDIGALPLKLEPLNLEEVTDEAWARVAGAAQEQSVTRTCRLGEGARSVEADRALLVRIFGNLFENAVRYAGQGRVEIITRRRGDRVEIRCGDDGPGVDAEHLTHLFEPFYRADPSRSRATGASGLGLMIVRRAIEAHGGEVAATSDEGGRGLVVIFDLAAVD